MCADRAIRMFRPAFAMIAASLAAVLSSHVALAQAPGVPPPGMAPPMMGAGPGGHMPPGMMGAVPGPYMGPGMMAPGMPRRHMHAQMMAMLGLTDDQRAQIERVMEETRRANWNVVGQLMSERFAMRELLRSDKPNPEAVVEQKRKIDELSRQLLKSRLEAHNRIQAMLSPEQQRIFRSMPMHRMGAAQG